MADFRRDTRLDQPRDPRLRLPRFDPEAFGRWSEAIARSMGTARFLVYMTGVIVAWFAWNTLAPSGWRFDPYTFTFLTLVLSLQASYAAPLILLAQNRQADRDRLSLEEDRRRATMQKADTEFLAREIASLRIALGEVATRDYLRSELNRLVEELDDSAQRRIRADRKEQRRHGHRDPDFPAEFSVDPEGESLDDPADRYGAGRAAFELDPAQATRPGHKRTKRTERTERAERPERPDRTGPTERTGPDPAKAGPEGAKKAPRASRG